MTSRASVGDSSVTVICIVMTQAQIEILDLAPRCEVEARGGGVQDGVVEFESQLGKEDACDFKVNGAGG